MTEPRSNGWSGLNEKNDNCDQEKIVYYSNSRDLGSRQAIRAAAQNIHHGAA